MSYVHKLGLTLLIHLSSVSLVHSHPASAVTIKQAFVFPFTFFLTAYTHAFVFSSQPILSTQFYLYIQLPLQFLRHLNIICNALLHIHTCSSYTPKLTHVHSVQCLLYNLTHACMHPQIGVAFYEMLQAVDHHSNHLAYMDPICDFLYHIKYMFTGDSVKDQVHTQMSSVSTIPLSVPQ